VKEYTIFHPLVYSFFSRSLYREVAYSWNGLGLLYLLLLLSLAWIPASITLHRTVGAFVDNLAPLILEQVPDITIANGEVSIQEPQPYLIQVPGSDSPLAVIDTTGRTTPQDFPGAPLLLTKQQIILREGAGTTRTYDLSGIRNFRLNRAMVEKCGAWLRSWGALVLYPFLVLGSYIYRIVQVLLYGALGILFARVEKADLEYADLVRLAAVAITPAVLLDTLRGYLKIPASYLGWFVFFAIAMACLFLAVRACAPPPQESRPAPGAAN
jgi:hypothetical protein